MKASRPVIFLTSVAIAAATSTSVLACPICFQVQDGPVPSGVRAAVVVLIGATTTVLAAAGTFVVRFAKRERAAGTTDAAERER